MITLFFLSLQCGVCLLWIFLTLLRRNKTKAQNVMILVLALSFVTFLGDMCFYNPSTDARVLVWLDALNQFAGPCVAPMMLFFVLARYKVESRHWSWFVWLTIPVVLGVTSAILYVVIGIDDAAEMMAYINKGLPLPEKFNTTICNTHLFVEKTLFYLLVLLQMVFLLILLVRRLVLDKVTRTRLWLFCLNRAKLRTNSVVVLLLIMLVVFVVGRCVCASVYYYAWLPAMVLSLLVTLTMTLICNVTLNVRSEWMRITSLGGEMSLKPIADNNKEIALTSSQPSLSRIDTEVDYAAGVNMTRDEYEKMCESAHNYLVIKQNYLDKDITLNKMAEKTGYNRSYLSYMINREYNMAFRDVVGRLRVEYAMKYMRNHPNDLQETVAAECGFYGASAFNRKFSQITGMTPRLWFLRNVATNQDKQQ